MWSIKRVLLTQMLKTKNARKCLQSMRPYIIISLILVESISIMVGSGVAIEWDFHYTQKHTRIKLTIQKFINQDISQNKEYSQLKSVNNNYYNGLANSILKDRSCSSDRTEILYKQTSSDLVSKKKFVSKNVVNKGQSLCINVSANEITLYNGFDSTSGTIYFNVTDGFSNLVNANISFVTNITVP